MFKEWIKMLNDNKTQEFLQKLAPCIERGELDACVEGAASKYPILQQAPQNPSSSCYLSFLHQPVL